MSSLLPVWHYPPPVQATRILRRIAIVLFLLLPGVWYVRVPLEWHRQQASPLTGDEPHYLLIADAVAREHSLRVRAAYDRDAAAKRILGPLDWWNHTRTTANGTFSIHSVGLGLIVARALSESGVEGVRVLLGMFAALIPFLFFATARAAGIDRLASVALALCCAFGLPFLAASGQVYPDLPAGVLLSALALTLFVASTRRAPAALLLVSGLILAFLPWLHLKNLLPMAIFTGAFTVLELRRPASRPALSERSESNGPALSERSESNGPAVGRIACVAIPVALSLLLLGYYNLIAFGFVSGPYTSGDAAATLRQAAMIFLGLHLDQAQGLFVQQPLFLLGLAGLPLFVRRAPFVACTLIAVYLAVLLPNSAHPCWYGCWSFSGRFMWSVVALWFFPLVFLFRELRSTERIGAAVLGGLALAWQVWLMTRWRTDVNALYTDLRVSLAERNSMIQTAWRAFLPSFYDFGRYLTVTTNILAILLLLGMLAVGVWFALRERSSGNGRTKQFLLPAVMPIIVAGVLTGVAHATHSRSIDLISGFAQAERRPREAGSETFGVRNENLAGETRQAIYAHPPSRITWMVTVPTDAGLDAWLGVGAQAWDADGDGVLFRIGVSDDGGYTELLTLHLDPRRSPRHRRWVPIKVDLTRYGGRRVSLIFNTSTGLPGSTDARNDLAYWGSPSIRTY